MKKTTKRILAFVLTLLTVVSLFSLSVAAVKSYVKIDSDKVETELGEACKPNGVANGKYHEIGNEDLEIMVDYSCDQSKDAHYIQYYCNACGKTVYQDFGKGKEHLQPCKRFEAVPEKAPTCTEAGSKGGKKCVACGKITGETVIPALGHKDTNKKDGKCDVCKADIPGACKYCYNVHGNSFSEKITSFFHGILASLGMHK